MSWGSFGTGFLVGVILTAVADFILDEIDRRRTMKEFEKEKEN